MEKVLSPAHRASDNRAKLGVAVLVIPREEHPQWFPSAKESSLKTYMQVTLDRCNQLYLRIYMFIQIPNMNTITVDEKKP